MKFQNLRLPSPVLFAVLAILQLSVGDRFSIYGIKPSLIAAVIYHVSISGGEYKGILYGAMGGFIEDCLSGGPMGLFTSAYAVAGFLTGRAGSRFFNIEAANFGGIFIFSIVSGIYVSILLQTFNGGPGLIDLLVGVALPQAVYNSVAGAGLLWLLNKKFPRRRLRLPGFVKQLGIGNRYGH